MRYLEWVGKRCREADSHSGARRWITSYDWTDNHTDWLSIITDISQISVWQSASYSSAIDLGKIWSHQAAERIGTAKNIFSELIGTRESSHLFLTLLFPVWFHIGVHMNPGLASEHWRNPGSLSTQSFHTAKWIPWLWCGLWRTIKFGSLSEKKMEFSPQSAVISCKKALPGYCQKLSSFLPVFRKILIRFDIMAARNGDLQSEHWECLIFRYFLL